MWPSGLRLHLSVNPRVLLPPSPLYSPHFDLSPTSIAPQAPLVSGHLPALLPLLYQQTVVRPEMVRIVDLGPFKHTVSLQCELTGVDWTGCLETPRASYTVHGAPKW